MSGFGPQAHVWIFRGMKDPGPGILVCDLHCPGRSFPTAAPPSQGSRGPRSSCRGAGRAAGTVGTLTPYHGSFHDPQQLSAEPEAMWSTAQSIYCLTLCKCLLTPDIDQRKRKRRKHQVISSRHKSTSVHFTKSNFVRVLLTKPLGTRMSLVRVGKGQEGEV